MPLCEIRVPTFRRPRLLARALNSLVVQTYPEWRCIVFDDCPDGSAEHVVREVGDPRIRYQRNETSKGAIGNIDQCFRNTPFWEGNYACVIEDDNYLLPVHLQTQLELCRRWGVAVTFSAQTCEAVVEPGQVGILNGKRTLVSIYPEGRHDMEQIWTTIVFSHAFSNGAVFWRLGGLSNFEIGSLTGFPGIQETARVLRVREAVYVSHGSTAVWRSNDPRESWVMSGRSQWFGNKLMSRWQELLEKRELLELRSAYLSFYGLTNLMEIKQNANSKRQAAIEKTLLSCGRWIVLTDRSSCWRAFWFIRGLLARIIIPCRLAKSPAALLEK